MKLKPAFVIFALLVFWILLLSPFTGATAADAVPQAVIDPASVEFSPVIAGSVVTHVFKIQNKGKAPLNIPGVYSE